MAGQQGSSGSSGDTPKKDQVVEHTPYKGTVNVREIDAAAWKNVGAEDQGKISWNPKNRHQVPVSEFNKEALAYFETDPEFNIVDA